MRRLGPLFGVPPTTVCRDVRRLRPLPALEPAPQSGADADRLRSWDGAPNPARDREIGASSRDYRFSANAKGIIDAGIRPVIATASTTPSPPCGLVPAR
ncbi:hypothetical protein ACWEPA_30215 [Streptomyces filamentosus]|uniref:hypothetical protein n=1 Tax=Streptomyces filamentosus TaxID=67294 RepID=UPI0037D2A39D